MDAMGSEIGIQVARLLDNFQIFQDVLSRALLLAWSRPGNAYHGCNPDPTASFSLWTTSPR
ncbi:MAG: hypothetical protein R3C44_00455 [Chloroflexota bacterium]